jgi:hypothetical protein
VRIDRTVDERIAGAHALTFVHIDARPRVTPSLWTYPIENRRCNPISSLEAGKRRANERLRDACCEELAHPNRTA